MMCNAGDRGYAGDKTVQEAWALLKADPSAVLIDVRTDAEWNFVGLPDLSSLGKETVLASWVVFPTMEMNISFLDYVRSAVPDQECSVLFLCRSGVRSIGAAKAITAAGYGKCYNILGGFEGDKDRAGHRGTTSGWKQSGLNWSQG